MSSSKLSGCTNCPTEQPANTEIVSKIELLRKADHVLWKIQEQPQKKTNLLEKLKIRPEKQKAVPGSFYHHALVEDVKANKNTFKVFENSASGIARSTYYFPTSGLSRIVYNEGQRQMTATDYQELSQDRISHSADKELVLLSADKAIRQAKSKLGSKEYTTYTKTESGVGLPKNQTTGHIAANCEQFVRWCKFTTQTPPRSGNQFSWISGVCVCVILAAFAVAALRKLLSKLFPGVNLQTALINWGKYMALHSLWMLISKVIG